MWFRQCANFKTTLKKSVHSSRNLLSNTPRERRFIYRLINTTDTHEKPEGGDQVDSKGDADTPETLDRRKAWQSAPSLASFELPIEGQSNDLVLFLGRYTDGKVDVVSPVPLAADKLDSVIERLGMPTVLEADRLPDPVERIAA
jgi:hypothetical protein